MEISDDEDQKTLMPEDGEAPSSGTSIPRDRAKTVRAFGRGFSPVVYSSLLGPRGLITRKVDEWPGQS